MILKVSEERLLICRGCPYNSKVAEKQGTYNGVRPDEHCLKCGCPLISKTKCLSCLCPLEQPKWQALVTKEEDTEISKEVQK